MQIKLKTPSDVVYHVEASRSDTVDDVKVLLEGQDCRLKAASHQVIYQGRILEDGLKLGDTRVGDGHVLLVVPRVSGSRVSDSRTAAPGRRQDEEVFPSVSSLQRRQHTHGYDTEQAAYLLELDSQIGGLDQFPDPDGDSMDLLMGVVLGFLLGCIAGLCLIEAGMSNRLKLGVLIGIACNVFFTICRLMITNPMQPVSSYDNRL